MVDPDNTVFLRHILDSCRKVTDFVKGIGYDDTRLLWRRLY